VSITVYKYQLNQTERCNVLLIRAGLAKEPPLLKLQNIQNSEHFPKLNLSVCYRKRIQKQMKVNVWTTITLNSFLLLSAWGRPDTVSALIPKTILKRK